MLLCIQYVKISLAIIHMYWNMGDLGFDLKYYSTLKSKVEGIDETRLKY